jgi:hypothetical protein
MGLNSNVRMRHNPCRTSEISKTMRKSLIIVVSLFLASCAATKPAPDAFKDAEAAIDAAVQAGAEEHSPVELRFAREKLAEARKGMEYKQYDKSIVLIEQSEINSELAIEKSRAAVMRTKVAELTRENEILRQDFESTYGEGF